MPGIYLYEGDVVEIDQRPSPRQLGASSRSPTSTGCIWTRDWRRCDPGPGSRLAGQRDPRQLLDAANFIATIEHRQGLKIACLEEIALQHGLVTPEEMEATLAAMPNSTYRDYVAGVLEEHRSAR